jgi:hypothetical protein
MFAQERGVDLVRWFTPDEASERKHAFMKEGDLMLTKGVFTTKITGLGLGLGADQDQDTQDEIAAAISKGSIDTLARPRNCQAESLHPESQAKRISLRKVFDVSKVTTSLSVPIASPKTTEATPITTNDAPTTTAMAARRGVTSPPRAPRPKPPPVNVPPIKPAAPLPLAQKPLWSPSAPAHEKAFAPVSVATNAPAIDLEREIEACLKTLARQSDMYHKLRARLNLDEKAGVGGEAGGATISAREITKALADLGLKLGPAGIAVMLRAVSGTPAEEP